MFDIIFKVFVYLVQTLIILAYVYKALDYLCKEMDWKNPLS